MNDEPNEDTVIALALEDYSSLNDSSNDLQNVFDDNDVYPNVHFISPNSINLVQPLAKITHFLSKICQSYFYHCFL